MVTPREPSVRNSTVRNSAVRESTVHTSTARMFLLLLMGLATMGILVACGGAPAASTGDGESSTGRRGAAVATMPAANFASVATQSGLTETIVTTQTTAVTVTGSGPDLALGERVYTNRCADCHGANAEGDSAPALAGLSLAEDEFVDLLRTGGDIGSEHLFGTRAVSENGIAAMYAYLTSLE